jgi:hypothetical protein
VALAAYAAAAIAGENAVSTFGVPVSIVPSQIFTTYAVCGFPGFVERSLKNAIYTRYPAATQFIPIAESNGLIIPIGEWVLRTACEQTKKWQNHYSRELKIAVNLSNRQFQQLDLHRRGRAVGELDAHRAVIAACHESVDRRVLEDRVPVVMAVSAAR